MGNPHAVIEHREPGGGGASGWAPSSRSPPASRSAPTSSSCASEGPSELTMRVWERGVGETLACGTGACAAAVAAVRLGGLTSPVTVHLTGGDLEVAVDDDLEVTMTGPAQELYRGELSPDLVARAGGALSGPRRRGRAAPAAAPVPVRPDRAEDRGQAGRRAWTSSRWASATPTRRRPRSWSRAMREQVGAPGHPPVPVQPGRGRPSARPWPGFYATRFGVTLDPATEIIPALGAKEAVANVNLAFLDPGDVALASDPGYPVYTTGPLLAGAEPVADAPPAGAGVPARPRGRSRRTSPPARG